MKTNPIEISKIFKINLSFRVSQEHRDRWLAVINQLCDFDRKEIIEEAKRVLNLVGKDKDRLYYLEAVRRNLNLKKHESFKNEKMPKAIKDLFK